MSADTSPANVAPAEQIRRALTSVTEQLGAVASVLVEFSEGRRIVRSGAGDLDALGLHEGEVHRNTGTSVSATVRLLNGETFGLLWASRGARGAPFDEGDSELVARTAGKIAEQIEAERIHAAEVAEFYGRISAVLKAEEITMVFQPIVELETGLWKGCESLARFTAEPRRTPDVWFAEAWRAGLGEELELVAVRKALAELPHLPDGMYMAVNVSPETILHDALAKILEPLDPTRIVIEVTEHAVVPDYDAVNEALAPLRARGIRLAVDDAGSGFASMTHIMRLLPDIIKLDGTVTNKILENPAQNALTAAMVMFARDLGARVVAEVVETAEHAAKLRELAVHTAQGWYFSKPKSPAEIMAEAPKA